MLTYSLVVWPYWYNFLSIILKKVFQFNFSYTDYGELVHAMARQVNAPVINNRFEFPESVGNGFCMFVKLPNGLQAHIVDCKFNTDWCVTRRKNAEEFYTLRFDELNIEDSLVITIDDEKIREHRSAKHMAYLTSSLFDWSYAGTKGSRFRGVQILFDRNFLSKHLDISQVENVLATYIALRADRLTFTPLDAKYRRWIDTIMDADTSHPMYLTIIINRIMLLTERFFVSLFENMSSPTFRSSLSHNDVARVMKVEQVLTHDLYQPAPSIKELAKGVAISESKLKKDFKLMYGVPIYEYYQQHRMQAAYDKLLTGKFSVKEVAMELGYANLSNFTIAFKKAFGVLPSQLLN